MKLSCVLTVVVTQIHNIKLHRNKYTHKHTHTRVHVKLLTSERGGLYNVNVLVVVFIAVY